MRRSVLLLSLVLLLIGGVVAASPTPSSADPLFGGIGWETARGFGGFSEQPPGGLVTIDTEALGEPQPPSGLSPNPGGTTLVADAWDTPGDGYLLGLDFGPGGDLYASTCDSGFCPEGASTLLEIDPATGSSTAIGPIQDGSGNDLNLYDLSFQPGTGTLYGVSEQLDGSCAGCLYTVDTATGEASLVGDTGTGVPGGLAFASDGTLYFTTIFPTATSRFDLYTLDPGTGATVDREDVLLERQIVQGNQTVDSAPLQGLVVAPDGTLIASGEGGVTTLYERIVAAPKDTDGNPIGAPQPVWRSLGDSGENVTGLAIIPEPGTGLLVLAGLAGLAGARRR